MAEKACLNSEEKEQAAGDKVIKEKERLSHEIMQFCLWQTAEDITSGLSKIKLKALKVKALILNNLLLLLFMLWFIVSLSMHKPYLLYCHAFTIIFSNFFNKSTVANLPVSTVFGYNHLCGAVVQCPEYISESLILIPNSRQKSQFSKISTTHCV